MFEIVKIEVVGCCRVSPEVSKPPDGIFCFTNREERAFGTFNLQSVYCKKEFVNVLNSLQENKSPVEFFRDKLSSGDSTFALVCPQDPSRNVQDESGQTFACNWVAKLVSIGDLTEDVLKEASALKVQNLAARSLAKLAQNKVDSQVIVDEVDCDIAKIFAQLFSFEILKFECQETVDDYNNDDTNGDTGEESVIERALSPVSRDESDAIHRRLLSDQQRTDIHTTFVNPNRPENRAAMAKPWFGPLSSSNSSIGFDFWRNKSLSDLTEKSRALSSSLSNWREVFGLMKSSSEQKLPGSEVDLQSQSTKPLKDSVGFTSPSVFSRKPGKRSHSESTDMANGGAYDKSLFLSN